jgi:hypothetical protein
MLMCILFLILATACLYSELVQLKEIYVPVTASECESVTRKRAGCY